MTKELTGIELREAVARALGWVSWFQKRGDYTHVVWQKPGEREPWMSTHSEYREQARKSYSEEPVPSFDRRKVIEPRESVPAFESSLDACFAPGGPVERLRADFGFDLGMTEANTWIAAFYPESGDEGGGQAESVTPAEAVCRAYLKAVEEPHD